MLFLLFFVACKLDRFIRAELDKYDVGTRAFRSSTGHFGTPTLFGCPSSFPVTDGGSYSDCIISDKTEGVFASL